MSEKLGYSPNGRALVHTRPGEIVEELRVRLHRDDFVRPAWTARVTIPPAARAQLVSSGPPR